MTTIVYSAPLVTPYYDEIIHDTGEPEWYEKHLGNYESYDFFVIKTRLTPYVPITWHVGFGHERIAGKMQYTVVISDAKGVIPLNDDEADKYQLLINNSQTVHPNYATLLFKDQFLITEKKNYKLPNVWVNSVLPYCYHHILYKYNVIMYEGQILIQIDDPIFTDVYYEAQNYIINTLYDMYEKGTVVANGTLDYKIIDDWQLVPIYNDIGNQLYTTTWMEERLGNPSLFLMDRLHRKNYYLNGKQMNHFHDLYKILR